MKKRALRSLAVMILIVSVGFFAARGSTDGPSVIPLSVGIGGQGQHLEISQDEKDSNELQPPEKVMDAAGVQADMAIGEVGAGNRPKTGRPIKSGSKPGRRASRSSGSRRS